MEEALAQLNPGAPQQVVDRTANGWGPATAGGLYGPITRTLSSGTYSVLYTDDAYPVIYSRGRVAVPSISATISRTLRVAVTNYPLFMVGIAARNGIDLAGNKVDIDSFNSADPNLSLNGRYSAAKASTNGDIASFAGVVNVSSATVQGDVFLGPTASEEIKKNGVITGGVYNDFNLEFESVVLPATSSSWSQASKGSTVINGRTYDYAFMLSGDYTIPSSGNIYVAPGATVRVKVTDNKFTATYIEVDGTGLNSGSLAIYMTGQSFTLSGKAIVDGGVAKNLSYYGTDSNTIINVTGNADFTGTIYAPNADFTLGGGGTDNYDFVGASVTKTLKLNGHFHFHFDEDLLKHGPFSGYVASTWDEI